MSESLSRYLGQLHSLLTADTLQRGVDANNTVVDLSSFCLENVSEGEIGKTQVRRRASAVPNSVEELVRRTAKTPRPNLNYI